MKNEQKFEVQVFNKECEWKTLYDYNILNNAIEEYNYRRKKNPLETYRIITVLMSCNIPD